MCRRRYYVNESSEVRTIAYSKLVEIMYLSGLVAAVPASKQQNGASSSKSAHGGGLAD